MAHTSSIYRRRDAFRLVLVGVAVGLAIALSIPAWGQRAGSEMRQDAALPPDSGAATYNVFFVQGSDQLDAAGKDIVALAAEHVRTTGARRIVVIPEPDSRDGDALTRSRAGTVLTALHDSRTAVGSAQIAPGGPTDHGQRSALDPRVEIRVLP